MKELTRAIKKTAIFLGSGTSVFILASANCPEACVNPPARPVIDCGVGLFFQGSALYWQAEQDGLKYALTWTNEGNPLDNDSSGKGHYKHPDFDWDWGFKVGAGYDVPHDGWDLFLEWTRFHPDKTHAHTSVPSFDTTSGIAPGVVYPLLLPSGIGAGGSSYGPGYAASMSWKLKLDLLDLELGREFFVSKWLTLRPFAGLRSAWLHQRSEIMYSGLIISKAGGGIIGGKTQIPTVDVGLKNNYWGMGPRIGLNAQWGLACGWSLYSDIAASILLGRFSIFEIQSPILDTDSNPVPGSSNSFSEHIRATRAAFDLDLGVRYERLFSCDRYGMMVQLGWEQHLFLDQNELILLATHLGAAPSTINAYSFTPVNNHGDLSTQGVTLTVEFDF